MEFLSVLQADNSEHYHNNLSHTNILDDLDKMNKELLTLEEQFLRLGVRTHLLEVELASQFSPDLLDDQERIQLTSQECELVVDQERQRIESLIASKKDTRVDDLVQQDQYTQNTFSTKDECIGKSFDTDTQDVHIEEGKTGEEQLVPMSVENEEGEKVTTESLNDL